VFHWLTERKFEDSQVSIANSVSQYVPPQKWLKTSSRYLISGKEVGSVLYYVRKIENSYKDANNT